MRVPAWLQRAVVRLFPANSAVARFAEVIDTLDTCSRKVYDTKKSAFEKGDEKTVEQIGKGKDIISILSKHSIIFGGDSWRSTSFSSRKCTGGRQRKAQRRGSHRSIDVSGSITTRDL